VDVLVLTPYPVVAGSVIKCRPIAYLHTEDEGGLDAKILCVPTDKVSTGYYKDMRDLADIPDRMKNEIQHFFERYKDNEEGKWVKVAGWHGAAEAKVEIQRAMDAYKG
ncbi:MAG: inorganic pyrophosphatase, partial [Gammaproteobacteria bacterium]